MAACGGWYVGSTTQPALEEAAACAAGSLERMRTRILVLMNTGAEGCCSQCFVAPADKVVESSLDPQGRHYLMQ